MAKKNDEKQIGLLMETLGITREEALELIAFDNEKWDNEEVNEIENKIKAKEEESKPKKKKGSSLDKVKNQKAKKKIDEVKEKLMAKFMETLVAQGVVKPQLMTSSKITFLAFGEYYSISLTKHKAKPDGFED